MHWGTSISFPSLTEPDVLDVRGTGSTTQGLPAVFGGVSAAVGRESGLGLIYELTAPYSLRLKVAPAATKSITQPLSNASNRPSKKKEKNKMIIKCKGTGLKGLHLAVGCLDHGGWLLVVSCRVFWGQGLF